MPQDKKQQLRKFADFAITTTYQDYFKPFLMDLLAESMAELDIEPKQEFDCVKRDIALSTKKKIISRIMNKIDTANDELNKLLKNNL
jgi:hypothetical protein